MDHEIFVFNAGIKTVFIAGFAEIVFVRRIYLLIPIPWSSDTSLNS